MSPRAAAVQAAQEMRLATVGAAAADRTRRIADAEEAFRKAWASAEEDYNLALHEIDLEHPEVPDATV